MCMYVITSAGMTGKWEHKMHAMHRQHSTATYNLLVMRCAAVPAKKQEAIRQLLRTTAQLCCLQQDTRFCQCCFAMSNNAPDFRCPCRDGPPCGTS